uniref:Uncharacterized protein n=1 Tax=Rangifer tarandus platyrhynchus TaxID=3082113 RepID=A0ACB0FKA7_RANTA|nr:unnamed protein product [Rangifer tarandus platyrhynchus]
MSIKRKTTLKRQSRGLCVRGYTELPGRRTHLHARSVAQPSSPGVPALGTSPELTPQPAHALSLCIPYKPLIENKLGDCPSTALLVGSEPSQTQWDDGSFQRGCKPGLLHAGAPKPFLLPAETGLEQKVLEFSHKPNLQTCTAPFHDDQWMRAEAALGSQEGHTGAAGADTPGQTWVRSRACAVRRKQRPGDDACVHEASHPAFRPELLVPHALPHRHLTALWAEARRQLSTQDGGPQPRAEPLPAACSFRAERSRETSASPAHRRETRKQPGAQPAGRACGFEPQFLPFGFMVQEEATPGRRTTVHPCLEKLQLKGVGLPAAPWRGPGVAGTGRMRCGCRPGWEGRRGCGSSGPSSPEPHARPGFRDSAVSAVQRYS